MTITHNGHLSANSILEHLKLLWWRCTYQLKNELMWHESLRSVSFNLLKSCNLNTHMVNSFLSEQMQTAYADWSGGISIDRWDSWSDFGNSVDCNLRGNLSTRSSWTVTWTNHGLLALDPLDGWVRVSQCLVRFKLSLLVPLRLCSLNTEWVNRNLIWLDSGSYDVSQPYTY